MGTGRAVLVGSIQADTQRAQGAAFEHKGEAPHRGCPMSVELAAYGSRAILSVNLAATGRPGT